jgi:choline dehydrogenase-like flavoprotein
VRARAVVLAGGALQTPVLLAENRLGRASGQLGHNLTIHPAAAALGVMREPIHSWNAIPQGYAIEDFHDEGLLFEGASTPPEITAAAATFVGPRFTAMCEALDRSAVFGFLIEDSGTGRVRTVGGRPLATYSLRPPDIGRLRRGLDLVARIFFAAGAEAVLLPVHGHDELRGEADLDRLRRAPLAPWQFDLSAYHPLGTCRMGRDPQRSVVGPDHQLHDLPGLYVMDGSALPGSPAVNPQITIMALATRAAVALAERLG